MKLMIVLSNTISIALLVFILEAYSKRIRLFKVALRINFISKESFRVLLCYDARSCWSSNSSTWYNLFSWLAREKENYLKIGDSITVNKFEVTLRNIELIREKNFQAVRGTMDIRNLLSNRVLGEVTPEYRFYLVEGQRNAESSIYHNLFFDIYVIIGKINKNKNKKQKQIKL